MFLLFVHGVATMDRKSFGRIGAEPFHYLRLSIATGTEELKKGLVRIAGRPGPRGIPALRREGRTSLRTTFRCECDTCEFRI